MSEEKIGRGLKIKLGALLALILLLAAAAAGFKLSAVLYEKRQPKITTSYISGKIESVSELTTAEMEYRGLLHYTDGDIPFLTQKSFSMVYTARIRAGVDLSKVKIAITDERVEVTVPTAELQSVDVDSDSIAFYDERYALFNWTDKEDVVDAVSAAREDAAANVNAEELIRRADVQTRELLKNILEGAIGDRTLVVK